MARKSRTGLPGLLLRQAGSARGASAVVVIIVLVVSALLAAWPRAVDHMFSAELRHDVDNVSPNLRNIEVTTTGTAMQPGQSSNPDRYGWNAATDDVWGTTADQMAHIKRSAPLPLRRMLAAPTYVASTNDYEISPSAMHADLSVRFNAVPDIRSRVHIVHGRRPKSYDGALTDSRPAPIEVMLSTTTAKKMGWKIGRQRTTRTNTVSGIGQLVVRLVGEFRAVDPGADFWAANSGKLYPNIREPANGPKTVEGAAFINPAGWGAFTDYGAGLTLRAQIPLKTGSLQISDAHTIAAQLRSFTSQTFQYPAVSQYRSPTGRSLSTGVIETIDAVTARAASTNKVLALLASAPVGVALAVLALASRIFINRRRHALTLIAARGASSLQRRVPIALEGLALGVPAAILAVGGAYLLIPAHTTVMSLLLPLLAGVLPGMFFAWTAGADPTRPQRSDLQLGSPSHLRWIVEMLVLVATAASVYLVSRQGAAGGAAARIDPLIAVTPLLLALSVCVVALRLFPIPMLMVTRGLGRGRGLIGFLGSARSVRERHAGFIPALVLIVGFGTAAFSGIMLSTVQDGIADAAQQRVGADVQVNGPVFSRKKLAAIRKIRAVDVAAAVSDQGLVTIWAPNNSALETGNVRLFVADLADLADVQQSLPGGIREPRQTSVGAGRQIPVIAGTGVSTKQTHVALSPEHSVAFDYVQVQPHAFGITAGDNWILMDSAAYAKVMGLHNLFPTTLLASTGPGVSDRVAARQLRAVVGSDASYATRESEAASINSQPSTRALQVGLAISLVLSAALAAAATAMMLIVAAPARDRLVAILRSYGVSRRQSGYSSCGRSGRSLSRRRSPELFSVGFFRY